MWSTTTTKEITNFLMLMKFVQNPIVERTKPLTPKSGRVSNGCFSAPLIWPKQRQTILEIKVSCSQWEGSACTHEGSSFFSFGEGGGRGKGSFVFLCAQCVPISSSQRVNQVPKLFLKTFPIAPQIYPIWFAQKFNSHLYKLKRYALVKYICLYFATGIHRCASIGECPMFQKKLIIG